MLRSYFHIILSVSLLFILNLFTVEASGQTNLDSLRNVWENNSLPDTARLEALNNLIWQGYLFNDPDSAYHYAHLQITFAQQNNLPLYIAKGLNTQGASLSIRSLNDSALPYFEQSISYHEKAGYKKGVASVLNNVGNIYHDKGNNDKATEYYQRSMKLLEELGDKKNIILTQSNLGNVSADKGDYVTAIDYFNKALKTAEALNDTEGIANNFNNIGIIYNHMHEYEKAVESFSKSLSLYEHYSVERKLPLGHTLNNLGNSYSYLGDIDKSLEYHQKSLQLYDEIGSSYNSANTLNNIGTIYYERKQYDLAFEYFNRGLKIFEEYDDPAGAVIPMNNIGRIWFIRGNNQKALEYSTKALNISKETENVMGVNNASGFLYDVYKKTGNYKKALEMHELYLSTRDSLQSEENQRRVLRQEFQYQYEKKAATDSLKTLGEKLIAETKIATQKAELEKERTRRYALYGGVLLLIFFGGFMYNRFLITKKQKNVIETQKAEVEYQKLLVDRKNKEILDSINYAKRIQQAILPPANTVKNLLGESFILYKPKDVVAGDFYWVESKDDNILFAAADCTGHGVPGAMVSVICNNGLNRSVRELGLTDPGKILDQTREIVIKEFEKSEEEVKDGMDIALCCMNGRNLYYAGAHNPLWIIRNGELLITKANKQPIGKFLLPKPYSTHHIELKKDDCLYIFSDGYADQFGGPSGRKFMSKSLKTLLLSIQTLPMDDQKARLDDAFEYWRGNHDQVDDVCVIGVRIN